MPPENPCLTCGACCAHFRVSFYWKEADPSPDQGSGVPLELTEELPPFRLCMQGTNQKNPRCAALIGEIGRWAGCTIYEKRPSPCREFGVQMQDGQMSFEDGDLERCNQARAAWGLENIDVSLPERLK